MYTSRLYEHLRCKKFCLQLGSAVYGLNVCAVSLGKIDLWKLISYMIHGLIESQILKCLTCGYTMSRESSRLLGNRSFKE